MILVGNHAPFTWGKTAEKAVYNSAVLESIAQMALLTEQINPQAPRLKDALDQKTFCNANTDLILIMVNKSVKHTKQLYENQSNSVIFGLISSIYSASSCVI